MAALETALDVVHVGKAKRSFALGSFGPDQIDVFAIDIVQFTVVAGRRRFGQIRQRIGIADADIKTFRLESRNLEQPEERSGKGRIICVGVLYSVGFH